MFWLRVFVFYPELVGQAQRLAKRKCYSLCVVERNWIVLLMRVSRVVIRELPKGPPFDMVCSDGCTLVFWTPDVVWNDWNEPSCKDRKSLPGGDRLHMFIIMDINSSV